MFFKRKSPRSEQLYGLYNAIVAQSRQPKFYAQWGVPDTLTGRFDVISAHMALVLGRLGEGLDADKAFAQELIDLFFKDMDRSLREMGVGDISVPKRMAKMGELFFGLAGALAKGLSANEEELTAATLSRNVTPDADAAQSLAFARYLHRLHDRLASTELVELKSGAPLAAQDLLLETDA